MNSNMKQTTQYLSAVVIAAAMTTACNNADKEPAKTAAPPPITTEVFTAQKYMMNTALQMPGELIAYQQVDIYAKENSFVKKLYVDVGSEVKAGQLLASMDAPEINAQLSAAASRLKSQEAVYIASKATYNRLLETSKTPGTIAPNDLDMALAKMNSDLAQLQAAKAAYQGAANTRDYLEIHAPFSGVISARNVNAGAYVGPSGKGSEFPIFTLQEQKRLRLAVAVPEAYTSFLRENDTVSFTVTALPSRKFIAQVKRLSGALDNKLRSQRTEMDVMNPDKKLLPGMVADVHIALKPSDSSFIVPKNAVVNSQERLFVIRVTGGKAEWVDVKKGREADGKIEIFGAINAGDILVKKASEEIRNGAPVPGVKKVEL
ncbi:MAG: efflux RND transporter periplasmic adaptor subunit [Bacteroidetes bacterium]|nr:efflux RND transporter periplasmic adaptor subunit [Bacteroidota bacterium]